MNRPLWKWLLAISLSLNIGMISTVAFTRMRPVSDVPPGAARHVSLPDHLRLDAGQRRHWNRIEQDFLKDIGINWREIRMHREALVRQIFSAQPDRTAIDAAQAKIAALQDAQQRRVIDQLLAEREVLDDGQRAALMSLLLARYAQEAQDATAEEHLHRD